MADMAMDPLASYANSTDHADIRREIAQVGADSRFNIADQTGLVRQAVHQTTGDIRHEAAQATAATQFQNATQAGDIRRDIQETTDNINSDIKQTGWAIADKAEYNADRIISQGTQFFIAQQQRDFDTARDLASSRGATDMSFARLQADVLMQGERAAGASALEAAKLAGAMALGHNQIQRDIVADGNVTRSLINELKVADLNRELIERNTLLAETRGDGRYWRNCADNGQWNHVSSQLNAFQSQLQETRQGIVNFGRMDRGAGQQTSTSNTA